MCITYLSRDSCRNLICKNLGPAAVQYNPALSPPTVAMRQRVGRRHTHTHTHRYSYRLHYSRRRSTHLVHEVGEGVLLVLRLGQQLGEVGLQLRQLAAVGPPVRSQGLHGALQRAQVRLQQRRVRLGALRTGRRGRSARDSALWRGPVRYSVY